MFVKTSALFRVAKVLYYRTAGARGPLGLTFGFGFSALARTANFFHNMVDVGHEYEFFFQS